MATAYFRGNRVGTRLSKLEMEKLKDIMNDLGLTNLSETVRFLIINANNNLNHKQNDMHLKEVVQ